MDMNRLKQATLKSLFLMGVQIFYMIFFGGRNLIIGMLFGMAAVAF